MKRGICIQLFDLHCDTLSHGLRANFSPLASDGAVDLRRGKMFSPWVQAFAVFIPDDLRGDSARRRCLTLLDIAVRWSRRFSREFCIVRTAADFSLNCVCHALLTGEGIGAVEVPTVLDDLYACGMRAATLTWNGDNAWASGCFGSSDGLTDVGFAALERMQTLGMTVDVSHLNTRGFWDVVRHSRCPIMASHSNSSAICPHPRNIADNQFCAIRDSGGVVGLSLYRPHLTASSQSLFADAFCRHLEHFLSLDGEDTVCIGTDFDGMVCPAEWNGMAFLQELYQQLLSRGYAAALLDKVFYTNAMRFFTSRLA